MKGREGRNHHRSRTVTEKKSKESCILAQSAEQPRMIK
jgi:hypothetical protein